MGGIDMPNLGGWYPQMVFETITNERGNEIYIAVEDGLKGVTIVTRGPESEATNTITKMEAEAVLRCLRDAIIRPTQDDDQKKDGRLELADKLQMALDIATAESGLLNAEDVKRVIQILRLPTRG